MVRRAHHDLLLGSYVPGESWLHRRNFASKVAALALLILVIMIVRNPLLSAAVLLISYTAAVLLSIPARYLNHFPLPLALMLLALGAVQWLTQGWYQGIAVPLSILASLMLARLLTWTTPISEMIAGISAAAPLLRLVKIPASALALSVGIMLRSVPVLLYKADQISDSAAARGKSRNLKARTTPLVLAAVSYAKDTGEALAARGLPEPEPESRRSIR